MGITQSTAYTITFLLVDATDDETPETGKSPTVEISKAGGNFAATTNAATENGSANGYYKVVLTTTETNTLGELDIKASDTGTNIWWDKKEVIASSSTTVVLSAAQMNQIADHVWRRTAANIKASGDGDTVSQHSGFGAMLKIAGRVKNNSVSGKLEVYESDEVTLFYDQVISVDATADPVVEVA